MIIIKKQKSMKFLKKNKAYLLFTKHSRNRKTGAIIMLAIAMTIFSCSKDDDTNTPPLLEEKNECITYTPTEASNTIAGTWNEPNDTDDYIGAITIPGDVGGGYVKIVLSQSNTKLRPALFVDNDFDQGGAIIGGSSEQTNNELIREAYFSVHPGESYSIRAYPFFNADTEDYPVDYTINWEFISKVDCFEPNDELAEAKKILLGETIEAYAISGYIDYFIASNSPNTYDWYKVVLEEAATIEVEVLDMPNDLTIAMRFFEGSGSVIPFDNEWLTAETDNNNGRLSKITSSAVLPPGTYYIEVHAGFVESRRARTDLQPIPEHFNKTYKIRASKK